MPQRRALNSKDHIRARGSLRPRRVRVLALVPIILLLAATTMVACGGSDDGAPNGASDSPDGGTLAAGDATPDTAGNDSAAAGELPFDSATLVEAIEEAHGPLGEGGEGRFLLGFMTTEVVDGIPVDAVESYNTGEEEIFAWVVFDGLDATALEGEIRIPSRDDEVVATAEVTLAHGHGWSGIQFPRPDEGWRVAHYEAVISSGEAEITMEFVINYHPTGGSSLVAADGRVSLPGAVAVPGGSSGSWQLADIPTPEDGFGGLLVESGRCLAFNYRGDLAVSDDGVTWESITPDFEVAPTSFDSANGRFFGFTQSRPNQYSSGDGVSWTRFEMGNHDPLSNIWHTHDGYVGGSHRNMMMHSEDGGTTWWRYGYEKEGHTSTQNVYLHEVNQFFYHGGEYWWVKEDGIERGRVLHDPDTWIPFGEDESRIAGARVIINGDDIIFWRHGTRDLWEYTGGGFARIDTDLGGDALSSILPGNGGYLGVRWDGAVLRSPDARDWHLVAESPEVNEAPGGSAIVGDRLVVIFGGVLYSTPID